MQIAFAFIAEATYTGQTKKNDRRLENKEKYFKAMITANNFTK